MNPSSPASQPAPLSGELLERRAEQAELEHKVATEHAKEV
jgi:hypothetical protein